MNLLQISALALLAGATMAAHVAGAAHHEDSGQCAPHGEDSYVCDIPAAEDLVRIPGTDWLIASTFDGSGILNLIDAGEKAWQVWFPSAQSAVAWDQERFPGCPAPLPTAGMVTHGLHLAAEKSGAITLYAVSHGARETIEVFEVVAGNGTPTVTWIGCVPTPDAQAANSVTALSDGSLLATIPLETGFEFAQSMQGVKTGAAWRWERGEDRWTRLDATAQPYGNGIEISRDETRFFIASSGYRQVISYSNTVPARELARSEVMAIAPDNLHHDGDHMLTAGMVFDYPACDPRNEAGEFDLANFGACPRPYQVIAVDPETLALDVVAGNEANPDFSNITMGVTVDDTLWIGTFAGDRVAYRKLTGE